MSSINDFATTYMCQSLPFGGVKYSGFDRFAGGCMEITDVRLQRCKGACMRQRGRLGA